MDKRTVCNYCGNIYDAKLERCPLCGSSSGKGAVSEKTEAQKPSSRPRGAFEAAAPAAKERRRPSSASAKKSSSSGSSDKLLKWSVLCLAAAVLIVGYTIGDFIGWWPGLEDFVDRSPETTLAQDAQGACSYLALSLEGDLTFTAPGQTMNLTVRVNHDCEEEVKLSVNESLIQIEQEYDHANNGVEQKAYLYCLTALAPGETRLTVTCGEQVKTCRVICDFEGSYVPSTTEQPTEPSTQEPTVTQPPTSEAPTESTGVPEDFEPVLNLTDVTLSSQGSVFYAKVRNLPDGAEVVWSSKNEKVATVNENGKVTAVGSGTTTITASVNGRTAELIVRCSFTQSAEEYHLKLTDVTIGVGESYTLRLLDSNGNRVTEGLTYRIGDSSVLSREGATVKGLAGGTTAVYVTYKGVEYKCIVRVRK